MRHVLALVFVLATAGWAWPSFVVEDGGGQGTTCVWRWDAIQVCPYRDTHCYFQGQFQWWVDGVWGGQCA